MNRRYYRDLAGKPYLISNNFYFEIKTKGYYENPKWVRCKKPELPLKRWAVPPHGRVKE